MPGPQDEVGRLCEAVCAEVQTKHTAVFWKNNEVVTQQVKMLLGMMRVTCEGAVRRQSLNNEAGLMADVVSGGLA